MRDLHELKLSVYGEPVTTPPPTADQLSLVERLIGAKLPAAYVEFLRFSNGGYPQLRTFYVEVEEKGYRETWSISSFFSITSDDLLTEDTEEVPWNYWHRWDEAPREVLPIACTAFGDLICLDLTPEGNGRVVLWAHEVPEWARGTLPAADVLLPVAPSFEAFIDSLTTDPDADDL